MSKVLYNKAETDPLVNGGTYEKDDPILGKLEGMVVGVRERVTDHKREGYMHIFGYEREVVVEGTESFRGWTLVGRPTKVRAK